MSDDAEDKQTDDWIAGKLAGRREMYRQIREHILKRAGDCFSTSQDELAIEHRSLANQLPTP